GLVEPLPHATGRHPDRHDRAIGQHQHASASPLQSDPRIRQPAHLRGRRVEHRRRVDRDRAAVGQQGGLSTHPLARKNVGPEVLLRVPQHPWAGRTLGRAVFDGGAVLGNPECKQYPGVAVPELRGQGADIDRCATSRHVQLRQGFRRFDRRTVTEVLGLPQQCPDGEG
ncbi:MAG: hypothetical protein ACK559_35445, partial [bacterium]